MTPYDWQESIGHRAEFVQSRLVDGSPVLALSLDEGILMLTVRRQTRKVYEVYDRLMFSAIGQQSDIEAMRIAAIDFSSQEGFQRSEMDVTIQRVVNALSQPLKRAFGDFNSAPFVIRALFAEVNATPADDRFMILDFDGDFRTQSGWALLTGSTEFDGEITKALEELASSKLKREEAIKRLTEIWSKVVAPDSQGPNPEIGKSLTLEAALLSRDPSRENRFTMLSPS